MNINNKSIRGIYLFDNSISYTVNDLVVYENGIYICNVSKEYVSVNKLQEYEPTNPEYFTPYPGKVTTKVEDLTDNPDYYVTSRVLNEVLDSTFFGLSRDGLIIESVDVDYEMHEIAEAGLGVNYTDGLKKHGVDKFEGYSIADRIMMSDIGSGVVKLSTKINEVKNLVTPTITGKYPEYLVLQQYKYKDQDGNYHKTQELIDFQNGVVKYREAMEPYEEISGWKSPSLDKDITTMLNLIDQEKTAYEDDMNKAVQNLQGNFCFKKVTSSASGTNTYQKIDFSWDGSSSCLINITLANLLEEVAGIKTYKNYTTSLDLADCNPSAKFMLTSGVSIQVSVSGDYITFTLPTGFEIKDIYYRKIYETT